MKQQNKILATNLQIGFHIVFYDRPCIVNYLDEFKNKINQIYIIAKDIFTGIEFQDYISKDSFIEVPFMRESEYNLISFDDSKGVVTIDDNKSNREITLPDEENETETIKKQLKKLLGEEENVEKIKVRILSSMGNEKIISVRKSNYSISDQ